MKRKLIWLILLAAGLYYGGRWGWASIQDWKTKADRAKELVKAEVLAEQWRLWDAQPVDQRPDFGEWRDAQALPDPDWFVHLTVDGDFFCGTFGEDQVPGNEDDYVFFWTREKEGLGESSQ